MRIKFKYDVFLSYNNADKPRVRLLAERLQAAGLRVWFDEWIVQLGDDISLTIERGLEASRTLVLCLSPEAIGSDWVWLERSTVLFRDPDNSTRNFIPLLLADCKLPDTLSRYKYVDYREEAKEAFDDLLAGCKSSKLALQSLRGSKNVENGRLFEDKVAEVYSLMGFHVQRNILICNKKVDILATFQIPSSQNRHRIIVECKSAMRGKDQNQVVLEFNGLLSLARKNCEAESAEIITITSWGDVAKAAAVQAGIGLFTFEEKQAQLVAPSDYVKRVVHDYAHFSELVSTDGTLLRQPVIDIMTKCDLHRFFVSPFGRTADLNKGVRKRIALEEYIDEWLHNSQNNHLSILGDFWTGKSSFCLQLTYRLAKKYIKDPINSRVPLFISLRDYAKAVNLQQLITDLLINKYNIPLASYAAFRRFLETGRMVLIFDGFDEMATKTDAALTIRNFEELTKAVVANSKTILTCRTHYFTDQRHVDEILGGREGTAIWKAVCKRPNFEIIELEQFTEDQIIKLLCKRRPDVWERAWRAIQRNLYDLAQRPIVLDMIIKTLDVLLDLEKPVNLVDLYDAYTRLWIDWDDWRLHMPPGGKQAFMEDLAMRIWTDRSPQIHFGQLRARIRDYFKEEIVTKEDLDNFEHDTRTCSFLNRDSMGNYKFIHESFKEFFVAKRLFHWIKENQIEPCFERNDITPEMNMFVAQLVAQDLEALNNLCHWAFEKTGQVAWNALSVMPFLKDLRAREVADNLVTLTENRDLKSGLAWVLGELGVNSEKVVGLLQKALACPNKSAVWWESAFALKKLNVEDDPVQALIKTLPGNWTPEAGLDHLKQVVSAKDKVKVHLDQQAVVAVVRGYNRSDHFARRIDADLMKIFGSFDFSRDTLWRRSYYGIWLLGELRLSSMLSRVMLATHNPLASVVNIASEALGKIGEVTNPAQSTCIGEEGLMALERLLSASYYRTRIHAAEAIRRVCGLSLLPA
ncbi:MAG: TIR domain-containing protein, partial [Candidatus Omnitrophica bacterium]|nr:TIR domain-containing protein [Candidatus Omnitrophota bacterium]